MILDFNKFRGTHRRKTNAAEAETSLLLVYSMGQAPETLNPTIPIMQLNGISHTLLYE